MIIPARFNGPDDSANGGYTAGLLASLLLRTEESDARDREESDARDQPVQVTLRRPPPLDRELTIHDEGGTLLARDPEGELVAEATRVDPFDAIVAPVPYPLSVAASTAYPGFADHPFPRCYVCGPQRDDGLRVFAGRLPDGRTAAPVALPADPAPVGSAGPTDPGRAAPGRTSVSIAIVWAALDCPGGWAVLRPGRPYVLGRMAAVVRAVPAPGARCVVVGAMVATAGRKAHVHTTLYGPDAELLGYARATWIGIDPPAASHPADPARDGPRGRAD